MKKQDGGEVALEIISSIRRIVEDVRSKSLEIERFDLNTSQVSDSSGLLCTIDLKMVLRKSAR